MVRVDQLGAMKREMRDGGAAAGDAAAKLDVLERAKFVQCSEYGSVTKGVLRVPPPETAMRITGVGLAWSPALPSRCSEKGGVEALLTP